MKAATLAKLEQAARDKACQLFYFDQSGFSCGATIWMRDARQSR